jgi:hypothetical protein
MSEIIQRYLENNLPKFIVAESPAKFIRFLQTIDAIIIGGSVVSAIINRPLDADQDLDIMVSSSENLREQRLLAERIASEMKHRGYTALKIVTTDSLKYGTRHFRQNIDVMLEFQNVILGRKIQFLILKKPLPCTPAGLRGIDIDCCKFFLRPMDGKFSLEHPDCTDPTVKIKQTQSMHALVLLRPEDNLSEFELEKLSLRIQKYEARGFKVEHSFKTYKKIITEEQTSTVKMRSILKRHCVDAMTDVFQLDVAETQVLLESQFGPCFKFTCEVTKEPFGVAKLTMHNVSRTPERLSIRIPIGEDYD